MFREIRETGIREIAREPKKDKTKLISEKLDKLLGKDIGKPSITLEEANRLLEERLNHQPSMLTDSNASKAIASNMLGGINAKKTCKSALDGLSDNATSILKKL